MTKGRLNKLRETMQLKREMEASLPKKAERCPQCNASRMDDLHGYPNKFTRFGNDTDYSSHNICFNNWHNTNPTEEQFSPIVILHR